MRFPARPSRFALLLCAAITGATAWAGTARAAADQGPAADAEPDTGAALEEILVTGEQPGPGLWRLTRPGDPDGHVLWILGTHGPLPRKLHWRSAEIEHVLSASQELLAPPSVDPGIGVLKGLTLLPSLVGIRKNPDGATLQQVLPADLYARWLPLKRRYLGNDDDVEQWRPIFAAEELYSRALDEVGLARRGVVWPVLEKLASRAHVPVVQPEVKLQVAEPRDAIKQFKRAPLADVDCFARTITRLESDLDLMRAQANAWAVGDVAKLERLASVDRAGACIDAVMDSEVVQQRGLGDMRARFEAEWVRAAEAALAKNASTLAVVPIDQIVKPAGWVARLTAKGYVLTNP
jgi:hypothetical protein